MPVEYGDELPEECTQIGKFLFRLLDGASGSLFPDEVTTTMRRKLPFASNPDMYDAFEENEIDFCDPSQVEPRKILRGSVKRIEEPTIQPRDYSITAGGGFFGNPGPWTGVGGVEYPWCAPLALQPELGRACLIRSMSAPNYRVIERSNFDNGPFIYTVTYSGEIDPETGRFIGLPETYEYPAPVLVFQQSQAGPHYQFSYSYKLQIGDEENNIWLPVSSFTFFDAINDLASCDNPHPTPDGNIPTECLEMPPDYLDSSGNPHRFFE